MLRVGLIGCGFMGTMHANCYKNIPGVELVALADLRPEFAQALAKDTNAVLYADGKDLIANAQLDIIDICLPTYLHAQYARLAMEKAPYVFIEKPVTLTKEEGQELLQKSVETGCRVQIGQVVRFMDEYVKLQQIIHSGVYGKVVNANFRRISPVPTWGWNNWLLDAKLSGGAAQDLHIHDIDYVLSVFGKPEKIVSVKNSLSETNSYIHSLLSYSDFVVGVEGTWNLPVSHPFDASFRVVFEKAVVELTNGQFLCYTDTGVESIVIEKQQLDGEGFKGGNISDLGANFNELVYFTDCAKNGMQIEKATLADASESLNFVLDEIANA